MIRTIIALIGPKRRNQMLALIPAMLLASLLEMAGLTMVVSVCASLADSAWLGENPIALWLRGALRIQSEETLAEALLFALIVLYALKLPYMAWESYITAKFARTMRHEVSVRLCGRIVRSPYSYFIRHSTAELQNLLGQDMFQFSAGLGACMQILMESLVALGMGICLLLIDPVMTLFLALGIVFLTLVIRVILIRPIREASQVQRDANRRYWKWLHHMVDGIKDIKTGRHEAFYELRFTEASAEYTRSDYLRQFWVKLPTLCMESIIVMTVLLYLFFFVQSGKHLIDYLPGLSALAWTAVRLLPAINRINASLTQMSYARASVEAICRAMEETAPREEAAPRKGAVCRVMEGTVPKEGAACRAVEKTAPREGAACRVMKETVLKKQTACCVMEEPPAGRTETDISGSIVLDHVSYAYDSEEGTVLRDVEMEIPVGTSVGIIGPSGAGKTTLLDILLGLLVPDEGEVLIGGVPIARYYNGMLSKIAYVPQTTFLLDDTIRSNVAMGFERDQIRDDRVWDALEKAALADKVKTLPHGLDTQIGERGIRLSGGERQRLGLARAIYRNPALIVFDEATSALDLKTESAVMDSINRLKGQKTLVIVSHRTSAITGCDRIYRVEGGTVHREK